MAEHTDSPPEAHVAHVTHGRVRLKIHGARAQPDRLERVRHTLQHHKGVHDVRVDHRTGSVVVLGNIAMDALRDIGQKEGLFRLLPPQDLVPLAESIMGWLETADAKIRNLTDGRLGLMSVTVAALVGIAAVQIYRGQVNVPALTLLWYAFSAVLMARSGQKLLLT